MWSGADEPPASPARFTMAGKMIAKSFALVLLLALAGCAGLPSHVDKASPCSVSEASMACQVERYNNVNVN